MGRAYVVAPDKIECTLEFTLSLGDWKQIRKTLSKNAAYTELKVMDEIDDLVSQIEQVFYKKV